MKEFVPPKSFYILCSCVDNSHTQATCEKVMREREPLTEFQKKHAPVFDRCHMVFWEYEKGTTLC